MTVAAVIILFLLGILLQRILLKVSFDRNIAYDCYFSVEEAFECDEIYFVEVIRNKSIIPIPWIRVEINSSCWLDFADTNSVVAQEKRYITSNFSLKAYQQVERKWHLKCTKRGIYNIEKITLISGDLFGGERYSRPENVYAKLMVFPKKVALNKFMCPMNYQNGSNIIKRWIIDDPFTYVGSKKYIPGDPVNKIDWKSTARTGELIVRKFDYTSKNDLTIILNVQSQETEYFGAVDRMLVELCIKVTGSVLDNSYNSKIPVKLISNGGFDKVDKDYVKTESGINRYHILNIYRMLAMIKLNSTVDFIKLLEAEWDKFNNTNVVIITSYLNEGIIETITKRNKNKQNRVLIILVSSINKSFDVKGIEICCLSKEFIEENILTQIAK